MFTSSKMRRVPSMRSYKLATHYQQNNYTYWYRLRALSFYLVVFALGCAFSAYLLSLGPQAQLERTTAVTKLSVLVTNPEGGAQTATLSRRGLYTSNTGGLSLSWERRKRGAGESDDGSSSSSSPGGPTSSPGSSSSGGSSSSSSSSSSKGRPIHGSALQADSGPGGHGSGQAQPPGHANVPADFNWKAYLLRYPDLRSGNIRTQDAAVWHYTEKGYAEHRSHERIPILLRYTACQGLFNQMYAHLNALVLADFLGADIMLPPSVYRESFSKYFSMDLTKNEVKWTPTDTGALLDVEALQQHYARKGMKVLRSAPYTTFPDCMHPQDAFPHYNMPGIKPEQVVRLSDTYLQSMHIWYLWDRAAEKVLAKHNELVAAGWPANTTVVLDLPCPFLSIMTLTCMESAQEAATALKFNRTIVQMARTIINGMKQKGIPRYNGAHLRLEKDAVDWARILGGVKKYLAEYAKSFKAAGFSKKKDLYIASGLLSYNASTEMSNMLQFLEPHSKSVQYKELYLPEKMLHGLNPEQEALVDFLVLANSDNFVGLGSSTFSVYLREYRVLLGHPRLADVFVDTSKIGTDALFERCTHFAPLDTTSSWHRPATLR